MSGNEMCPTHMTSYSRKLVKCYGRVLKIVTVSMAQEHLVNRVLRYLSVMCRMCLREMFLFFCLTSTERYIPALGVLSIVLFN